MADARQGAAANVAIDAALVRRLLAEQFPQWAALPITPAVPQGWDNRTFRLGATMSVRLPSAAGYAQQVAKEHRWLPFLAPHLPLPIPAPLAMGVPTTAYPWPWSVYRWIDGVTAEPARIGDLVEFATDLGRFLAALQQIDPTGGPPAGAHSWYRGASLAAYNHETQEALAVLDGDLDTDAARVVWDAALQTTWTGAPVWVHGDVAVKNLLVRGGRLHAVIDFGCCCIGDPACDTVIAWTLFAGESRAAFRQALPLDDATWTRGRGWALWKALITLAADRRADPLKAESARRVIQAVLADSR